MRAFACSHCGQLVFFENSLCLRCSTALGFVPSRRELLALEPGVAEAAGLRTCANLTRAGCNWIVEPGEPGPLCRSCALTRTRPGDQDSEGLEAFRTAEHAKRRLLFQLLSLGLPLEADGLQFDLLSSRSGPVVTGHQDGLITIDLAESDDVNREQRRAELDEPYRTMLGHFRHEIGHYYWPRLVEGQDDVARYRELFGDERLDYEEALQRYYDGPTGDWRQRHVSAYATMHPWEDWAESFAHYLHINDTLETAAAYGMLVNGPRQAGATLIAVPAQPTGTSSFDEIIGQWLPLTYALNAVNRSMGKDDLYPFTLAAKVIEKLAYVHDRVLAEAGRGVSSDPARSLD